MRRPRCELRWVPADIDHEGNDEDSAADAQQSGDNPHGEAENGDERVHSGGKGSWNFFLDLSPLPIGIDQPCSNTEQKKHE